MSWSVLIGAGYTEWSGPYEANGQWAGSLIALSTEVKASGRLGVRLELGGAISEAGARGTTTLVHERTQLGLAARAYPLGRAHKWSPYGEAGAAVWLGARCIVQRSGALLGKRLECAYFQPDPDGVGGTLRPNASGVSPFLGIGVRHRAFGFGARYDIAGPRMFENDAGSLTARTIHFTIEWVFKRGR